MEREETREAGVVALYALSFHEEIAMPETVRALKNSLEKSNPEAMVYAISLIEKLCEKWKGVDTEILTKIGALEDNMATVLAFDPNLETWAPVKISAYAESALKKIGGYRLVKSLEAYLMTANEISGIQRLLGSGDETERIEAAKTLRNLTKKWIVEYPWLFGKEFIEEVVEEMEKSSNPQFVASTLEMISLVSSGSKDSANIVAGSLDGIIHAVFENTVLESKKDRDFVISLLLRLIFTTLPLLDEKAAREFVTAHFELFSSWLGEEEPEVVGLTLSLFLLFCNLGLLEETHKDVLNTKLYDIQSEEILQKEFVDPNGKKEKISGIFGSLSSKIMETEEAHYVDILRREYRIGRLLGSGATCEVYLATRKKDNFPVALKIYREEFGDKAKRTFTRELTHWKELTDIESPRVVKFYGLVKLPGLTRDVLEVEYMPGGSLKDYVEKEKPQQAKLGRLLYQMVEGLIYAAYKAQIYHTDMKPEHILLSHDRRECKITDWGGSRKGHSRSTSYARTDRWCAPEQIIGSTLPTERSTVYAVASIIYWTFTGKAPFESFPGESEETIRKKK
ncbi:MAG: protein kinase, partial [Thermoplasmata archaeon]